MQWSDEFDDDVLDEGTWGYESPFYGAGAGSVHIYRPAAVSLADGNLRITATRLDSPLNVDDDHDGTEDRVITWQSGFITTRDRVDFTHGRFEVRLRAPRGLGLWPAVWLRPLDRAYGSWPRSGEIDIMEVRGHQPDTAHTTAHWWDDGHRKDALATELAPESTDGYRVFALEWTPERLVWLIDDAVVHVLDDWPTSLGPVGAPFDQAFHLNINLAVGGRWAGGPDGATPNGATLEVDWIRVYELGQ